MSQREDVLFCKIAITNGLVSEQAAQKVLALCDKREQEAGRRPLIGAVFTKHNLIKPEDVRVIYDAVKKRLGRDVGPQRVASSHKSGRFPVPGQRERSGRFDRQPSPAKAVDPTTLWMGILGLVGFLGILGAIFFIIMRSPPGAKPAPGAGSEASSSSAKPAVPKVEKAVPRAEPPAERKLPKEVLQEVNSAIGDARSVKADDPKAGLTLLESSKKRLEEKGYTAPEQLLKAITEFREAAKQAPAETSAPPATAGGSEKGPSEEGKAAPGADKSADPGKEDSADDDLPSDGREQDGKAE